MQKCYELSRINILLGINSKGGGGFFITGVNVYSITIVRHYVGHFQEL